MNGGDRIASVLVEQGVRFLFTLCGGHISPILVGAKQRGIRVVDVRHEVDAVFAADAVFRLTGVPGVAAVTAGPGVTNTITAIKNAQLAQSAVVLLGGAAATLLKGRGALQDIDQMALFEPHVKWAASAADRARAGADAGEGLRRGALGRARPRLPGVPDRPALRRAPGAPVVRRQLQGGRPRRGRPCASTSGATPRKALRRRGPASPPRRRARSRRPPPERGDARKAAARLRKAKRPVLVLGGQVLLSSPTREKAEELAKAVAAIGAPVYLAGGARGLLGAGHALQLRHKRREALREADLVLLAGIPNDFRLDYGRHISRKAFLISVNRSEQDLRMNRKPDLGVHADPGLLLRETGRGALAAAAPLGRTGSSTLRARDEEREREIDRQAAVAGERVNPIHLCREIDRALAPESVIVADGGDFVATAAYTVSPRGPLSWLDPGRLRHPGRGRRLRPRRQALPAGGGRLDHLRRRLGGLQPGRVRHLRPPRPAGDRGGRQRRRLDPDRPRADRDPEGRRRHRPGADRLPQGRRRLRRPRAPARTPARGRARRAREAWRSPAGAPVLINAHLDKTEFRKGSISM